MFPPNPQLIDLSAPASPRSHDAHYFLDGLRFLGAPFDGSGSAAF